MKKLFATIFVLVILLSAGIVFIMQNEGTAPNVLLDLPSVYIRKACDLKLLVEDEDAGLRSVKVLIIQDGNERVLIEKDYNPSLFSRFVSGSVRVKKDEFNIPVEIKKYGMIDGPAVIRVHVSDASWKKWGRGNIYYQEKEVVLDFTPPRIKILTKRHNLCKGGTGLAIYQVFEPDVKTGVKVGNHIFPGHSGLFENPDIYAAFFALDHTQGPGTKLAVYAEDKAGNISQRGFRHYIRDKKFKHDVIKVTEAFLKKQILPFDLYPHDKKFDSLLDKFLFINDKVREENSNYVLGIAARDRKSSMMWKGRFLRMKGAAPRAGFADKRTYKYKGKIISKAVHLGKDLASTLNDTIGAANSGKVILAENVGIFGNTVIIDHGLGITSLYSHMDSINVQVGQEVKKGDDIGKTGITGLAVGDHLHFSMIVHDVFVNPIEWWDAAWIKNNIASKIQRIKDSQ